MLLLTGGLGRSSKKMSKGGMINEEDSCLDSGALSSTAVDVVEEDLGPPPRGCCRSVGYCHPDPGASTHLGRLARNPARLGRYLGCCT